VRCQSVHGVRGDAVSWRLPRNSQDSGGTELEKRMILKFDAAEGVDVETLIVDASTGLNSFKAFVHGCVDEKDHVVLAGFPSEHVVILAEKVPVVCWHGPIVEQELGEHVAGRQGRPFEERQGVGGRAVTSIFLVSEEHAQTEGERPDVRVAPEQLEFFRPLLHRLGDYVGVGEGAGQGLKDGGLSAADIAFDDHAHIAYPKTHSRRIKRKSSRPGHTRCHG